MSIRPWHMKEPKYPKTAYVHKNCVTDLNIQNMRILLEVDLNVPIECERVSNNHKIVLIIPTIKYMLDQGCRSILLMNSFVHTHEKATSKYSLQPVANELQSILFTYYRRSVVFLKNIFDPTIESLCSNPPPKSIFLIENVSFDPKDIKYISESYHTKELIRGKVLEFRKLMRKFADKYVIEAFFVFYLKKSTFMGTFFPYRTLGLHAKKEWSAFRHMFRDPFGPFIAVIGGNPTEHKLKVILNMLKYVDGLVIGGATALIYLKQTQNMNIGDFVPVVNKDTERLLNEIVKTTHALKKSIFVPWDFKITRKIKTFTPSVNVKVKYGIPNGFQACDIGPLSLYHFPRIIEKARTILLYGTLGVTEHPFFQEGTMTIFKAIAERTEWGALSIAVGESTTSFAKQTKFSHKFSHTTISSEAHRLLQGEDLCALSPMLNKTDRYSWQNDTQSYNIYEEERSKLMKDTANAVRLPEFVNVLTRPATKFIDPVCGEDICPFTFSLNLPEKNNEKVRPESSESSRSPGYHEIKCVMYPKNLKPYYVNPSNSSYLWDQKPANKTTDSMNRISTSHSKKRKLTKVKTPKTNKKNWI